MNKEEELKPTTDQQPEESNPEETLEPIKTLEEVREEITDHVTSTLSGKFVTKEELKSTIKQCMKEFNLTNVTTQKKNISEVMPIPRVQEDTLDSLCDKYFVSNQQN